MSIKPTTIAISDAPGDAHKITKIQPYKNDGFAAFAPYHTARCGYMLKHPCDYSQSNIWLPRDECVEYSASDQVKLSIHLSGFVQFSSVNQSTIRSGIDSATGRPKGIGIVGEGPIEVSSGPLFGLTVWGIHEFETVSPTKNGVATFSEGDFYFRNHKKTEQVGYFIEVFMFPRSMFEAVTGNDGTQVLKAELPHQSNLILQHELRVIDLPCQYAFLGVLVTKTAVAFPTQSGFVLNGPSCEDPETGEFMSIAAIYPRPEWNDDRQVFSLDYTPDPAD